MSRRGRASAACKANARPSASDKSPRPCDAASSCRYARFIYSALFVVGVSSPGTKTFIINSVLLFVPSTFSVAI